MGRSGEREGRGREDLPEEDETEGVALAEVGRPPKTGIAMER